MQATQPPASFRYIDRIANFRPELFYDRGGEFYDRQVCFALRWLVDFQTVKVRSKS
jgi:hypothetical protein